MILEGPKMSYQGNKQILNLAAEIADSSDIGVVPHLLKLEYIIEDRHGESAVNIRNEIWNYDLLHVLSLSLKLDFNVVPGSLNTATKLVNILCKCCVGLLPDDTHDFLGIFLPDATEKILTIARKIQMKYIKTAAVMEDTKEGFLNNFRYVLESLSVLFGTHNFLSANVLKSLWLQQMLMSDDSQTVCLIMTLMQSAIRMKTGVLESLDKKVIENIFDELVYKLSTTENVEVASTVTRTLLVLCDSHPSLIEFLSKRYKGFRHLLNRWSGKGFGRDLKTLILLLDSGNAQEAAKAKLDDAASKIQALWKGYYTRVKLKKADAAMSRFQLTFRARKDMLQTQREQAREQAELKHFLLMQKRKAMRDLHTRKLEALKILPAAEVNKFLERDANNSALKIQSRFRGYSTRKKMTDKKKEVERVRAAIKIQRQVRKWLESVRDKRNQPPAFQRPPGLSDQRRVQLNDEIIRWRTNHILVAKTEKDQHELHNKVQEMLRQHVMRSQITRKKEQHREALISRVELDSSLLVDAPKLDKVQESDIAAFRVHSLPIATKARLNHANEIKKFNQPWFRKLEDMDNEDRVLDEMKDSLLF